MSNYRTESRAVPLAALDAARWRLLNFLQALFLIFWTGLSVSLALVALALTWRTDLPLSFARRLWGPPILKAAGARLNVKGLEHLEGTGPCIFVSNHQSMIDIAVTFTALPRNLRFVAKRELLFVPFIGWYLWGMGMIPVDRSNRERAAESLKRAALLLQQGAHIIAFPEGTRSRDGRVLPFKKGVFLLALEAGVPIVPLAIDGAAQVLPSDGFRVRPGEIRIAIGEPIPTAGLSADDRDALIHEVRERVIALHRSIGGPLGERSLSARVA